MVPFFSSLSKAPVVLDVSIEYGLVQAPQRPETNHLPCHLLPPPSLFQIFLMALEPCERPNLRWLEQELSEDNDNRSSKKQRVDDDANEQDEKNQQSLVHLSQEVERITRTIEAVNGTLDDHTLPWVQSAMERHLPNILQKAVEKMSHKSVQELVDKYSQEIVKSVDTLIRPSLLETVKQSVEKTIENALAKTVNEAVEEALKRFNDKEMEAKKESLIAEAVIKKMEERMTVAELEPFLVGNYLQGNVHGLNRGFNFVAQTAINQMNVKGKLDGEWVYQEAKGKGAKICQQQQHMSRVVVAGRLLDTSLIEEHKRCRPHASLDAARSTTCLDIAVVSCT
eukprot:g16632.t1